MRGKNKNFPARKQALGAVLETKKSNRDPGRPAEGAKEGKKGRLPTNKPIARLVY